MENESRRPVSEPRRAVDDAGNAKEAAEVRRAALADVTVAVAGTSAYAAKRTSSEARFAWRRRRSCGKVCSDADHHVSGTTTAPPSPSLRSAEAVETADRRWVELTPGSRGRSVDVARDGTLRADDARAARDRAKDRAEDGAVGAVAVEDAVRAPVGRTAAVLEGTGDPVRSAREDALRRCARSEVASDAGSGGAAVTRGGGGEAVAWDGRALRGIESDVGDQRGADSPSITSESEDEGDGDAGLEARAPIALVGGAVVEPPSSERCGSGAGILEADIDVSERRRARTGSSCRSRWRSSAEETERRRVRMLVAAVGADADVEAGAGGSRGIGRRGTEDRLDAPKKTDDGGSGM